MLALLPLTKENGIVFVAPFALYALLIDAPNLRARIIRVAYVAGLPVASELLWRLVRKINGATPWSTWVLSDHADDGSYVVALRAMFGFESGEFFRQNMANAFIVNWLWLPGAAGDRHARADLPPPVAGVRAARGGADRRAAA